MRKFIVFALLFAAGLFLLMKLDRGTEPNPADPVQVELPDKTTPNDDGGEESSKNEPSGNSKEPLTGNETPVVNEDGWTPTYQHPNHDENSASSAVFGVFGEFSTNTYNKETGIKDGSFRCDHTEPVGDPTDLFYLMIGVDIRFQDPETGEETMVLKAEKVRGQLSIGEGGGVQGVGGDQGLEMRGVVLDVLSGHALAPFRLTAQNIRVNASLERFVTERLEPVVLTGQGILAKGWNLNLDRVSGQVDFLGGGEFEFESDTGNTVRFVTEKGTPLHLSHTEQGQTDRFQLRVIGGGVLNLTGEEDWQLESRGLALQATKGASGKYFLERLDTSGTVRAVRGKDVFSGSGMRMVRASGGQLLDLHITQNPKAELQLGGAGGDRVEIRGTGSMLVHAERKKGESEQADLELLGGGSILFPRELDPLRVTFRDNLTLRVDHLHESGKFTAKGHVHVSQGEAWLRTDTLDSIVWSAHDQVVDVACEGDTTARLHGSEHGDLDFKASQGALLQVKDEEWKFPQASGVHTTRLGDTPLNVRANELRDLDAATGTFRAWGDVSIRNPLGSMECDRIEAHEGERLRLFGIPDQPVHLELVSGVSIFKDLLSGTLEAMEVHLNRNEVTCLGQVQADLLTNQGRLRYSSDHLVLSLDQPENEADVARLFSEGSTRLDWEVAGGDQIHLDCQNLHMNGKGQLELSEGENDQLKNSTPSVFSLTAEHVSEMSWVQGGSSRVLETKHLKLDGQVGFVGGKRKAEVQTLLATGGFSYSESGERNLEAKGSSLEYNGESKDVQLKSMDDEAIVATGLLPEMDLPFRMNSSTLSLSKTELLADDLEMEVGLSLLPVGQAGTQPAKVSFFTAKKIRATPNLLKFSGGVFVEGTDLSGAPLTLRTENLTLEGNLRTVTEGSDALQSMDELRATDGFALEYGGLARASGQKLVVLPSSFLLAGSSSKRVRVDLDGLYLETERLVADLDDFLVTTDRGVMRGGGSEGEWSLEYASLQPIQRGGETMFAMASPAYSQGSRTARSNWAMAWINLESWRKLGRAALWGDALPETQEWIPHQAPNLVRPDLIQNFLASLAGERLPHYLRAVLLEGDVEASTQGRRVVRADSLYADVSGCQAWLEKAEISKFIRLGGLDHKLRIRTNQLVAEADGSLRSKKATITSCDHEEPHYVVEVGELELLPRQDQRWKFSAEHNRIAFQNGMGLPMPSISNVVLDSQGGFEGFENDQGEVVTVDNLALQNTPRFGTILGTSLAYDLGSVGKGLASLLQFDSDKVRGRWRVEGSYLSSRGPLLGLGLQLREKGREGAKREEFWLDIYARGIAEDGTDRGLIQVPSNETPSFRHWVNVRGRYPFGDRQWLDVVFNQQTDPGMQAEFYQKDYQRFEERESYVHWRKARDGHFFNARVQTQSDNFRTEIERKPSVGAFRGLAELFRVGPLAVNYSASADVDYVTRMEGDARYEDVFLNASGLPDGLGERSSLRADSSHRIEIPIPTGVRGTQLTPFVDGRFTAWDKGVDPTDNPSRLAVFGGVRLQGAFSKVSGAAYHTLIPRVEFAHELALEQTGGDLVGFDSVEDSLDGDRLEVGLRSLWQRPDRKHWLDFDTSLSRLVNRDDSLPDTAHLRFLGGMRTQFGNVPVGLEQDYRKDLESDRTLYSLTVLAAKPTENLLTQLGHQHAWEDTGGGIYEAASLSLRYGISDKWELGLINYTNIQDGGSLASEVTLRRFSHDFVLELEVTRYAGEGGTGIGLNFMPLLAWKPSRMGILDRD